MYTPVAQKIALTLKDNEWVFFNPMNQILIDKSIISGGIFEVTPYNPLRF